MRPKHIIFDLDGTLLHFPHEFFLSRSQEVFRSLGYREFTIDELRHAFCKFDFFSICGAPDAISLAAEFWERFRQGPSPQSKVIDGVPETLNGFRERGLTMAIATARDSHVNEIHQELSAHGILQHVSAVASRSDRSIHWADKRSIIEELCTAHNLDPSAAVMVGDTPSDVYSAKAAGIGWTVAVLSGGIYREVLEACNPDYIVSDVSEVPPLLLPKTLR